VIKDRVAVIVFNNKEAEKLAADIKEKISCAETSGMAGQREYDVLSQCLGRPEQHDRVRGVSNYQGWKYAWPQHVEMYRKKKRTKTVTSVDTEKIKEQIKQELVAEMWMQNMQMQRWCCHQMVLSPMSNCASPSPATLKSSFASTDVGLIDGTAELATEVRCDDRTHEDLIGMLTEPTHYGLWITWRGLQCEAALGLVHPEETTLQTVPIHEDCVVVEVITVYTIFADEMLEYPPNDEVMKLGQAQEQRLQWRRCRIDIKGAPTCISRSQAIVHIPCSSHSTVQVPSSDGSPPPPPP
jgi:DNA-directed RNA polymerase subunit N (RpoN/RPB10)